jgi:hypothetical protein
VRRVSTPIKVQIQTLDTPRCAGHEVCGRPDRSPSSRIRPAPDGTTSPRAEIRALLWAPPLDGHMLPPRSVHKNNARAGVHRKNGDQGAGLPVPITTASASIVVPYAFPPLQPRIQQFSSGGATNEACAPLRRLALPRTAPGSGAPPAARTRPRPLRMRAASCCRRGRRRRRTRRVARWHGPRPRR